jgi:hypothetical protein
LIGGGPEYPEKTCCKSLTNLALVVIGTDCIGSYKSNYHMITTTEILLKVALNTITPLFLFIHITKRHMTLPI